MKLLIVYLVVALIVSTIMHYNDSDDADKNLFADIILYFLAMLFWPLFFLWICFLKTISKIKSRK